MLRNLLDRIAAYPFWKQTLFYLALYLAGLLVLGLLVLLSPFVMIFAGLVLMAAIFALIIRFLNHGPVMRWGLVALTSLVLLLMFMGISNALYFSVEPEQAGSPEPDKQTPKPEARPEPPEQAAKHESVEQPSQTQRDAGQAEAQAKKQPGAAGSDSAEESQPSVTVMRVVDGDTIEITPSVSGKNTVTLVGIDAPEGVRAGCGPQPLSQEAANYASLWVGAKVRLEFDQERTDGNGQLLAYVHNPATAKMMNVDMVQSGYAQVYIVPPNTRHEDELREAQDLAKSASGGFGTGIWSLSPAVTTQLADHGNGIGNGDGACPTVSQLPESTSTSSASSSASPNPYAPSPNSTSSATPSASPAAGGSSSSASPAAGGY